MRLKNVIAGVVAVSVLTVAGLARAADLTVSAAASLTNAFRDMQAGFEQANPGVKLVFNFAASGPLLKQMEEGAPVDVFASADQATMDKAVEKKLMDEATRQNFAANALVLIAPAGSPLKLAEPKDLTQAGVTRIAIGNPDSVPVGRYAKAALASAGLWDALLPKCVLAESVRQALDYVGRGEVEAGFVYMTDARIAEDKVKVVAEVAGHAPVTYPIAVTATSASQSAARAFVAFVLSEPGQTVLARYGFKKP